MTDTTMHREEAPVADETTTRLLADHGARISALEQGLTAIFAKLEAMQGTLATLVAEHRASHTPETCWRSNDLTRRVEALESAQRADEREHATKEETADLRKAVADHERRLTEAGGAGKGLHLALGVLATAIAIIGALVAFFK
jgi:hypothetical protein